MTALAALAQAWPRPTNPRPVAFVGAGGIVESAQLPAYRRLGLTVAAVYDIDVDRARRLAEKFGVPRVHASLEAIAREPDVVFDLAVPARAVVSVLESLPEGATVLIQKPMGETLDQARRILDVCKARRFVAAVNFQLRYAPNMLTLRALVDSGALGSVIDFEVRVNVHTPWDSWPFLAGIPRHEVLYHSVHYLDLARSFLGDPAGVSCSAVRHPNLAAYSDTRSATLLDYGDSCRATIGAFHTHVYGRKHQASELKLEGTRGAAVARMGVNLDYPRGEPDLLEVCFADRPGEWESVPLRGSWFDEAFEGPISNLQRFAAGEDETLLTHVDDSFRTMAVVDACYRAQQRGGVRPELR